MLYKEVDVIDVGEVKSHASLILKENTFIIQDKVINQGKNFFIQFKTERLADKRGQKVQSVVVEDKLSFTVEIV